ncbi:hypothetical protein ONZ45_g11494 [Pleurotus djamor]|nr:hypothetical protein ONZ45_g11494 [Pleurotus djamor]
MDSGSVRNHNMAILTNFAAQSLIDEEIDAEMKRHWDLLKRLRSQRNTHCAVNQLPTDVLERIFLFVKDEAESAEPFSCEAYSEWTVLLYVCRTWHDIIIDTPRLWSTIELSSPHARQMLARSKAAPLRVSIEGPIDPSDSFWPLLCSVISQSSRLQELMIDFTNFDTFSRAFASVSRTESAPLLQKLAINIEHVTGTVSGHFWEDLPALQFLALSYAPLPPGLRPMPNLTTLNIGGDPPLTDSLSSPSLLHILQSSPAMQIIDIEFLCGPSAPPDFLPISLPSLKLLHLGSYEASTISILSNLAVPPSTKIEIFYNDVESDALKTADLSGLKSSIAHVMSQPTPIDRVIISFGEEFRLTVYFLTDTYTPGFLGEPSICCLFPAVSDADAHIFLELCELVTLSKTSILHLDSLTANNDSHGGLSWISRAQNATTLIIEECHSQILRPLRTPREVSSSPPLEYIHFLRTKFINADGRSEIYKDLVEIVRERKECGVPIKKVVIKECEIDRESLFALRELVPVKFSRK